MPRDIDVLIPTYDRPAPLAVTLATLVGQTFRDFRVVVSDQMDPKREGTDARVVRAVAEVLRFQGMPVEIHENLPRRGRGRAGPAHGGLRRVWTAPDPRVPPGRRDDNSEPGRRRSRRFDMIA